MARSTVWEGESISVCARVRCFSLGTIHLYRLRCCQGVWQAVRLTKPSCCVWKTLCLLRTAPSGPGPVSASHTCGRIFFRRAVEQRCYQPGGVGFLFVFSTFKKLTKFSFWLKIHVVSNIRKYKILYIRKPPSKMPLLHFLLLSRAEYSEIILQSPWWNLKGGKQRADWVGTSGRGRTMQWIPWVFFLFNCSYILVWALENASSLESPANIDKRRKEEKKKEESLLFFARSPGK